MWQDYCATTRIGPLEYPLFKTYAIYVINNKCNVFKYLTPHRYYLIPKLNDILIHKTGVIKVYYLPLHVPVSLFIKLDTTYIFSPQHSSLNLKYLLIRPFILLVHNFQSLGLK